MLPVLSDLAPSHRSNYTYYDSTQIKIAQIAFKNLGSKGLFRFMYLYFSYIMSASNSKYSNVNILHLTEPNQLELAYHVRREVYVVEQGYLPNVVTDEYVFFSLFQHSDWCTLNRDDPDAEHWAAIADKHNEDGSIEPNHSIGTIRLVRISENVARLGRVAVLSNARGLGVGPKLVKEFIEYCKSNGYHTIYLHAVTEKKGFYEKLGFVVEDGDHEEFEEDGTPHIRLWKRNIV